MSNTIDPMTGDIRHESGSNKDVVHCPECNAEIPDGELCNCSDNDCISNDPILAAIVWLKESAHDSNDGDTEKEIYRLIEGLELHRPLLDIIMSLADKQDSPSNFIIGLSDDNRIVDFLMDEYDKRTQA